MHKLKFVILVLFGACILLFGSSARAATWLDPSLSWKTIETPHFSIHFHDGLEDIAERFAPMAEEVHDKLVPVMKYRLDLKTSVVLVDSADYGNGWTTVIPDPRITLYLTDWSTNLNPSKFDLWLKFVFLHEYVHALHLDMAEGGVSPFRLIFGRVIFPNAIEPWFIIEGLATYMETKYTQAGRGRDPRWEMMMRMDVLENNLKSINQAAVSTVRWPLGHLRYLYGVEFLEYLAETYGEDKIITLTHIYGDFLLSYGIDGAFLFVYRKSLKMLWEEWLDYMRDKYAKEKAVLGELTSPKLVTHSGYYNLKPKWSRDSRRIFYQQRNADGYPSLRQVDAQTGNDTRLLEAQVSDHNLSLGPAGKNLLLTKLDIHRNYYSFKDLYLFNLEQGRLKRLTQGMRALDADFSPEGKRIVFVRNRKGTHSLMLMASDGSSPQSICSYEANVQYFSPRWSLDQKYIAVAKWSPGGQQKIYLVNPETGSQERLTLGDDLASEANPCFAAAGDYLFFDSDRTGIVNLYAFDMQEGRMFQVTNVLGGAMMPDVSPDGKQLAYVSYSSQGYDVAVMEVDSAQWREVFEKVHPDTKSVGSVHEKEPTISLSGISRIQDYNPLPTLTPKFWLPLGYANENGSQTYIYTQGMDVLNEHLYVAAVGYDFEAERPQYSLVYVNDQFSPQIVFRFNDMAIPYSWGSSTLWMREKYDSLSFSLYDNRVFSEWDKQLFSLGFEQTNIVNISSIESLYDPPDLGNIHGVFLAWRYLNARQYVKSISPEDGIDLSLRITMNSPGLGSDYTYTNYRGSASAYFGAPLDHHVISPTLYGFYSKGDQLEQSNYSWRYLPLRGYPSTNLRGNKGILLASEYRFPVSILESGWLYGNTFFENIKGKFFYDLGGATFNPVENLKLKRSYGAQITLDTSFAWGYYALSLSLVYAKGLDEGGKESIYFAFGDSLAELLWYNREHELR